MAGMTIRLGISTPPLVRVEIGDRVGHRHRVANEYRLDEADPIVAERDRGLVDALALDLGDHQRRGRRHETYH
jgi:hypothetical protein